MIGHDAVVQFELNALRAMGIELQIDDFGTGYSSLSQLQRLDIDVLKIDQSFVQALESNEQGIALCEAMISIGKTLKIVVVAEVVETPRQLSLLQMMGCDEVQGFFISPPLTPDKMANFLIDDSLFEHRVGKLSLAT
jgi:EAL domain-containing protein (putative c-di-GMP-specific phosphodiesterase class I)